MASGEEKKYPHSEITLNSDLKQMWLFKIPKQVHEIWAHAAPDQEIGTLVQNRANGDISLYVTGSNLTMPKEFKFSSNATKAEQPAPPPMVVFSETKEGVALEGKVELRGELTPVNALSAEYRELCRKRLEKSMMKTRVIKKVDDDAIANAFTVRPVRSSVTPSYHKKREEDKRVRGAKGEVLDLIFSAFAKNPYWDLKSLINHTDQPQAYLKELLQEVCIYNKKGPNRLMYELKPEFKVQK